MTDVRAVVLNCWGARWGGGRKAWLKRLPRLKERIQHSLNDLVQAGPSIVMATELSALEAKELCAALGEGWAFKNYLYSTVLYKGWKPGRSWSLTWNKGTHGTIVVELTRDGQTINVAATHLPPFSWRANVRKRCMRQLSAFFDGWKDPVLMGGDFNWRNTLESYAAKLGFDSVRVKATNKIRSDYRTNGGWGPGSQIDYAFTQRMKKVRGYRVLRGWHPATHEIATDHNMLTVQVTA